MEETFIGGREREDREKNRKEEREEREKYREGERLRERKKEVERGGERAVINSGNWISTSKWFLNRISPLCFIHFFFFCTMCKLFKSHIIDEKVLLWFIINICF